MSDLCIFVDYLDVARWYQKTTIRRHVHYLLQFENRCIENHKPATHNTIREYRNDMLFYVSSNTVYKYLTSISVYAQFRYMFYNDKSVKKECIDYPKYVR